MVVSIGDDTNVLAYAEVIDGCIVSLVPETIVSVVTDIIDAVKLICVPVFIVLVIVSPLEVAEIDAAVVVASGYLDVIEDDCIMVLCVLVVCSLDSTVDPVTVDCNVELVEPVISDVCITVSVALVPAGV